MPYRCPACGRSWEEKFAELNGLRCLLEECGGALLAVTVAPPAGDRGSVFAAADVLPYPAAVALRKFEESLDHVPPSSAWDRVTLFKDALEATVKSYCAYGLGIYLATPSARTDARDDFLADLLIRLTTSQWVGLLKEVLVSIRDCSEPGRSLFALFFSRGRSKDVPGPAFEFLSSFGQYRNELHHAARRPEKEYERELSGWLPRLSRLVLDSAFLAEFPLIRPTSDSEAESWSGTIAGRKVEGRFPPTSHSRFGFVAPGGRFLPVDPFIVQLDCGSCAADRVFMYEGQKQWGIRPEKKQVYLLEYDNGHRPHRTEPAAQLESHFTQERLQRVYNAFRKQLVAIEKYLTGFGSLVDEHADIVGRQSVLDRLVRFQNQRRSGVLLITGEPGIGKTALMALIASAEAGRVHFFYRHSSGLRSPDDFIACALHMLLARHGWSAEEEASSPAEQRAQLTSLLKRVSPLAGAKSENEVIVVDALDEAGLAADGSSAAVVLPADLPDHVYLVVSSRRENPDLKTLLPRRDVEVFDLRSDSPENKKDALEYLDRMIGARASELVKTKIAEEAGWNFLVLRIICESIARDEMTAETASAFLGKGSSLENWYSAWWERLTGQFATRLDEYECITQVIGAVATSLSPVTREQICESLNLSPGRFDWALRYLGQFLDVIPISEKGPRTRGEREVVVYRLYHETFRAFVRDRMQLDTSPFHQKWSRYFASWSELEGQERDAALRDLPTHLLEAERWNELEELLTDLRFIEAKTRAGMIHGLLSDYAQALRRWPENTERVQRENEWRERMCTYASLLRDFASSWADGREGRFSLQTPAPLRALKRLWKRSLPRTLRLEPPIPPACAARASEKKEFGGRETPRDRVSAFGQFVGKNIPSLASGEEPAFQLAHNSAHNGPVQESANEERFPEMKKQPWIRRESRPYQPPKDPCLRVFQQYTRAVALSANGCVAVAGGHGAILLWDVETGEKRELGGYPAFVTALAMTPDGRWVLAGDAEGCLRVWDLPAGTGRELLGPRREITSIAITSDGRHGITANGSRSVHMWDLKSGESRKICRGWWGTRAIAMTGEGRKLVTSSHFGSARLWDLEKGWGQRLKRRSGRVDLLAITPDGSYAISEDSRAIKV